MGWNRGWAPVFWLGYLSTRGVLARYFIVDYKTVVNMFVPGKLWFELIVGLGSYGFLLHGRTLVKRIGN